MNILKQFFLMLAVLICASKSVLAQPFTITDIAGRNVTFEKPVERIILGEGRMIYALAAVGKDDPFAKVVGWRNDLWTTDRGNFDAYVSKFPKGKDIPFLGNLTNGTLQTETIAKLQPDVMLMLIGSKSAADETGLEETLGKIGVKLVYIDFRDHVIENTEKSLKILGELIGEKSRGEEVAAYWKQQISIVTDRIQAANVTKRKVFLYGAAGISDCCITFGADNFGLMVDIAGGHNIGADFLPGYTGQLNPEQIVASNPDVVIVTGSDWSNMKDARGYVRLGAGTAKDSTENRASLAELMRNPAFANSTAVTNREVHAIWHQFYINPYQFVAVQKIAKWLHPDLFADLDPDATFREFHANFLPIDYDPGYWLDGE